MNEPVSKLAPMVCCESEGQSGNTLYRALVRATNHRAYRLGRHLNMQRMPIFPGTPARCDQLPMTPRHDFWHYTNPATPQMEAYINMHNHVVGYLTFGFLTTTFMLLRQLRLHSR